jgi:N-acetylmuramoyl-L-alanine amidase
MKIVISSGHAKYVRGASGLIDEVHEARRVVEQVAEALRGLGVDVVTYHDDIAQRDQLDGTLMNPGLLHLLWT